MFRTSDVFPFGFSGPFYSSTFTFTFTFFFLLLCFFFCFFFCSFFCRYPNRLEISPGILQIEFFLIALLCLPYGEIRSDSINSSLCFHFPLRAGYVVLIIGGNWLKTSWIPPIRMQFRKIGPRFINVWCISPSIRP